MAIVCRGMDLDETARLTEAMMRSGTVADLSGVRGFKVDKHSTGGVGDKVSLHLAPMVAACGVAVPMISGRGLGHSGGTLDKLESIPGFNVNLSLAEYARQVEQIGCALIGQTRELAPADKTLYALRDVTATVECIPLICASILSKKLAEGIDGLVLDVKFGVGAFMKDLTQARELARTLVAVATRLGKPTRGLLTAMEEPLGSAVGNAVEVAESIACLRGHGPRDLMEVTYSLGEHMLVLAGVTKTPTEARARLEEVVENGRALEKFREIIRAQGGAEAVVDEPERVLPQARQVLEVRATAAGYVQAVDAYGVALVALRLGAGRARAEDQIDPAVGITGLVKVGDRVEAGQPLGRVHANDRTAADEAVRRLSEIVALGSDRPAGRPLIADLVA